MVQEKLTPLSYRNVDLNLQEKLLLCLKTLGTGSFETGSFFISPSSSSHFSIYSYYYSNEVIKNGLTGFNTGGSRKRSYVVSAQLLWRHEAKNLRETRTNHSIPTWQTFFFARTPTKIFAICLKIFLRTNENTNLRHSLEKN